MLALLVVRESPGSSLGTGCSDLLAGFLQLYIPDSLSTRSLVPPSCFVSRVWLVGGVGLIQSSSLLKSTPFREHIKDGPVALGMNFILHSPELLKIDERSQDGLDRPNAIVCLFGFFSH